MPNYTLTPTDIADLREGATINVLVPGSSRHEDIIDGSDFTAAQLDAIENGDTVEITNYDYAFGAE